jgi:putative oxidoreductase
MERWLGRYSPYAYALMRIVVGVLFASHGAQKLFGMFGGVDRQGGTVPIASMSGVAGVVELVGGILVAIGFLAGFAAFIASGEMASAYFIAHAPRGVWPLGNGGEVPALYCFVFLYIATRGAGVWSVDAARPPAPAVTRRPVRA